ncbi:hypothetical protein [Leucothrix arctica]|uniref:Uncharacterized protein n=1 Tax=Leucothrix arctica TaxID=1481894 RepID=A0A317CGH8_9GAMM|nr:hypothetical protein [Leucothrix arctica]PWQ97477.1 hypothetical protein DKT75_06010 [Leucothrix arctica]
MSLIKQPIKILLDNNVLSNAEYAVRSTQEVDLGFLNGSKDVIDGFRKKPQLLDLDLQEEVDAIFTIGLLIKEGKIVPYTSTELIWERSRRRPTIEQFNALRGCDIATCPSPIERSKLKHTINFNEYVLKGGKKDKKRNENVSNFNQIPFFVDLKFIRDESVKLILENANVIGLTNFEKKSFEEIEHFKDLCNQLQSDENLPDAFHVWTAERNDLDVFLTLEKRLTNSLKNKSKKLKIDVEVLRPTELLKKLNITPAKVRMKYDHFYSWFDTEKHT